MNPVKLIFRHGGEMLVSPIGLRFVEDPDHGPLVLIPEFGQPRGYQLDMTLEEARRAFSVATLTAQVPAPGEISRLEGLIAELKTHAFGVAAEIRDLRPAVEMHETRLDDQREATHLLEARVRESGNRLDGTKIRLDAVSDRSRHLWAALAIHLGLPEGWEHLHELAAGAKGALVSQAEMLDSVKAHVDALYSELGLNSRWEGEKFVSYRDTDSILTEVVLMQREVSRLAEESFLFTVAERIGELEEAHRLLRNRTEKLEVRASDVHCRQRRADDKAAEQLERRIQSLEADQEMLNSEIDNLRKPTVFPLLDDRTCVQQQVDWTGGKPLEWHEGWEVGHRVGMSDQQYLDSLEPEKPKSAWKPVGSEIPPRGPYLIRKMGIVPTCLAECVSQAYSTGRAFHFLGHSGIAVTDNYEFCPIPE